MTSLWKTFLTNEKKSHKLEENVCKSYLIKAWYSELKRKEKRKKELSRLKDKKMNN